MSFLVIIAVVTILGLFAAGVILLCEFIVSAFDIFKS